MTIKPTSVKVLTVISNIYMDVLLISYGLAVRYFLSIMLLS